MPLIELIDFQKEFNRLADDYGLMFQNRPIQAGAAFQKLIVQAYIAGKRKEHLQHTKTRGSLEIALAGLNDIAAWHDGPAVNGKFDSPGTALKARQILQDIYDQAARMEGT